MNCNNKHYNKYIFYSLFIHAYSSSLVKKTTQSPDIHYIAIPLLTDCMLAEELHDLTMNPISPPLLIFPPHCFKCSKIRGRCTYSCHLTTINFTFLLVSNQQPMTC